MKLEQKYEALLHEARQLKMPDVEGIRLCFQTLSVATSIDRDWRHMAFPRGVL
ncbi:hypothetical protein N7E01_08860 [Neopusillimonas aromaticivorans]|jgi:MarR family transcriptional regulator, negative regulator of the multidrug operon emrRAB|nr:hypothetical protein [Neopusillimonas aromaticivorans]WJJ94934.1 hypothetical protein N7E01_08860 [Neopusillimonas aromaticivorans]